MHKAVPTDAAATAVTGHIRTIVTKRSMTIEQQYFKTIVKWPVLVCRYTPQSPLAVLYFNHEQLAHTHDQA